MNFPFFGDQTLQIYVEFEGFPLNSALMCIVWVGNIMTTVFDPSCLKKQVDPGSKG